MENGRERFLNVEEEEDVNVGTSPQPAWQSDAATHRSLEPLRVQNRVKAIRSSICTVGAE